jgi:putative sigma-54 modulation protein
MRLQVSGSNVKLDESLLDHVDRRFRFALDRLESEVSSVLIKLGDVNGPKGGVDKQCKVLVKLASGGNLVLRERSEDVYQSVSRASDRVKRLVRRRIDRRKSRRRRAPQPSPTGTDETEE